MILITLALIATAAVATGLALSRHWFRVVTSVLIWLMIVYVLLFYSGSVARAVLRPGAPAGGDDGFYLGVQMLQVSLLDSHLLVLYLSLLNLLNFVWFRKIDR